MVVTRADIVGLKVPLALLEPEFVGMPYIDADGRECHPPAEHRGQARGVLYACPEGYLLSGRSLVGVHHHLNWQPDVGPEFVPGPGRWWLVGGTFRDLTLRGVRSDSVAAGQCHFFVRNGICEIV